MRDLVWRDPPTPGPKYADVAAALRANSGRWALWPHPVKNSTAAGNLQRDIRTGRLTAFPRGEFQATVRVDEGTWTVYVKHVGTGTAAAARPRTLRVAGGGA